MQKAAVCCLFAALTIGGAGAQDAPGLSEPTIRVTATEVLLDISVRDKHGRLVKNLKPSEVEIYEDGVRQKVLSFRLAEQRRGEQRPAEARTARSLRAVHPVCVIFHNLSPVARKRAVEAVQEFLKSEFPPETYVGLFVLDDRLKPVHPFTKDREELLRVAQNPFTGRTFDFTRASEPVLTANPTQVTVATVTNTAARTSTTTVRITGGEVASTAIVPAETPTGPGANAMRAEQVRERGTFSHISEMRDTDQVVTMIKELAALPGRKSVLFVTTGLIMTGDTERFQAVVADANRSGLSVYALDARGLDEYSTMQAGNLGVGRVASVSGTQSAARSSLGDMREKSRQMDYMEDAVRGSDVMASLRALAEGTGGFLIANTNEFRKPFQNIVEDLDTHYEAVYRPASGKYDGQLRTIEVRLTREGLSADARGGYFAIPDVGGQPSAFETTALAVLNARPLPHAFDFHAAAYHFRRDAANYQGALAFEVPGAALTTTPDAERKTQRLHVSVLALVKRADGQVVDKFSLDAPYDIPEAELPMVRAGSVSYSHPLNLPPGRYTVETAVIDGEGRRASTHVMPLETPEARKGVDLSSVLLIQRVEDAGARAQASDPLVIEGKRAVPVVGSVLSPQANPHAYFIVYPDRANRAKPRIRVEFLVDGQLLAKQEADLPPADPTGKIPMMVGAATRPGNCELRITALQGEDSSARSAKYTVVAR